MKTISIIIPARNEEYFIKLTLSSIQASEKNHNLDYEIIIVNDSSTDRTKAVALNCDNVKVYDVNFKNRSKARNFGASKANGDYLLFVDADTTISKELLINSLNCVNATKKVLWYKQLPLEKDIKGQLYFFIFNKISRYYPMHSPVIFFERNLFFSLGGFDESLNSFEDHYLIKHVWKIKIGKYCDSIVYTSLRRFYKYGVWGAIKQNYLAIKDPYNHKWESLNK